MSPSQIPQLSIKFYDHNANKTIPFQRAQRRIKAIVEEWEKVK